MRTIEVYAYQELSSSAKKAALGQFVESPQGACVAYEGLAGDVQESIDKLEQATGVIIKADYSCCARARCGAVVCEDLESFADPIANADLWSDFDVNEAWNGDDETPRRVEYFIRMRDRYETVADRFDDMAHESGEDPDGTIGALAEAARARKSHYSTLVQLEIADALERVCRRIDEMTESALDYATSEDAFVGECDAYEVDFTRDGMPVNGPWK